MSVLCFCKYVHVPHSFLVPAKVRSGSDPLELEWQTVVSLHVCAGDWTGNSEPSLQQLSLFLKTHSWVNKNVVCAILLFVFFWKQNLKMYSWLELTEIILLPLPTNAIIKGVPNYTQLLSPLLSILIELICIGQVHSLVYWLQAFHHAIMTSDLKDLIQREQKK